MPWRTTHERPPRSLDEAYNDLDVIAAFIGLIEDDIMPGDDTMRVQSALIGTKRLANLAKENVGTVLMAYAKSRGAT